MLYVMALSSVLEQHILVTENPKNGTARPTDGSRPIDAYNQITELASFSIRTEADLLNCLGLQDEPYTRDEQL